MYIKNLVEENCRSIENSGDMEFLSKSQIQYGSRNRFTLMSLLSAQHQFTSITAVEEIWLSIDAYYNTS
jgi:hypothetical protein